MSGLEWPEVDCCMGKDSEGPCICGREERALRGWMRKADMPAMTEDQREYCLNEIGMVEGWVRAEHEDSKDYALAGAVITAWKDYCSDMGML